MVKLISLPTEVASHIFQACEDFPEVIALASTCSYLHSVWQLNSATIIWKLAKESVRCLDIVLMAVRATAIVLEASQANSPPPPFPSMYALSGNTQKPTIAEMKEVFNMQHLVRCVEYMYFNSTRDESTLFGGGMLPSEFRLYAIQDEVDAETEVRKERFYQAMYQLLLAGAVLCGSYNAPFWEAKKDSRTEFIEQCKVPHFTNHDELEGPSPLTGDDRVYARQFPVYNFDVEDFSTIGKWREKEYEGIFGPFAKWLVDEGNARRSERLEPEPESELVDSDGNYVHPERTTDRGALQDLMCLLVGYEHLICKFTNADMVGRYAFGRFAEPGGPPTFHGKTRKVTIILFGVFRVEEVTMPLNIEETRKVLLPVTIHPSLKGSDQETFNIWHVIWSLTRYSRSPTANDRSGEHPDPPAMFQLWFFALRQYLNLGFSNGAFYQWRESMWWEDVGGGTVFHDPEWAPVQPYVKGKVSWHFSL
ncbi:hypothetical protein BKA65DRAFT_575780 [Rhexocercosporidium sp. MPI-PUGE-AT-0058]|nr:hypothetical protein BKA65DRAFT_575780 [Rhexocercosporidium sp. MPI-PUGE-AT-0058]